MPIEKSEVFNPEELLTSDELINGLIGPKLKKELEKSLVEVHAERLEENLAKGIEDGLAKIYAKKYAKNFAIGYVEGVIIGRIKNAIALKKQGVSSEIIADYLNMTIKEVETLTTE